MSDPRRPTDGRRSPALSAVALPLLGLLGAGSVTASLTSDLATIAYLLVAEILAIVGAAGEVALEHHSRSRVLALADIRGLREATERRLMHLPRIELTARLVRFLGHALLVTGIAYLAFREHMPEDGDVPWARFGLVLLVLFGLAFLVNGVMLRLLVMRRPNRVMLATLPYLEVLRYITWPLRQPLVLVVRLAFRTDLDAASPSPRDEILESVVEGKREGSFTAEEAEMIGSIIEMETSQVTDVLTPRADVVMIQADATIDQAVDLIRGEGYSRIPVYGRDRDDVIGVLYAHDLLAHWRAPGMKVVSPVPTVRALMRAPLFVPENKSLNDLLREMRSRKVHMAVVLDEFNGTEGLVTIEDLLEEIVGEIEDEYDESEVETAPSDEERAAGVFRVEGRLALEEVNQRYEIDLPIEDDFETLAGLVFHQLGKVPEAGDRLEIGNVVITVVEADERTARSLLLHVLGRAAPDGGPTA
ncbi:MAG: hemolysin family protein [Planctomycetota bacterium]|nr:hemolysin family protein [Planctomycetota bacterium]